MSWIELPQSKYKGNTNTLKNLRLQVKISVSKLIFPLFVPPLFLKASKSLFYNGKR
ncbi:hypothetical protein PRABACTJOHN_03576 [Parabacteroides johnsonii DSM 18315]|uniref:Uncharacterized protein n=1 Tax=Parabacteroides johnsonii DSM 18315 TaxID=537006 RepID=B7BEU7_9BACT|nr:hypothetical protein PRABACTJOHN_03576 [Parabacteroides johnsonii DSM 18315]